jgi:DNA-binding NtrC family response regulator
VRELKNAIERAYIMSDRELELEPMNLHAVVAASNRCVADDVKDGVQVPIGSSLAQAERWLIEATLAHWSGNKNRAAKMLGCSLKTLYNKLATYEREGMQAPA